MKKIFLLVILLAFSIGCNTKTEPQPTDVKASDKIETTTSKPETKPAVTPTPANVKMEELATPAGFKKMESVEADLDKDGVKELIAVFDTPKTGDFGTERQLQIFKPDGAKWKLWQSSSTAVMPSEHGGVMGDPFQSIAVENGVIVINHFGGSRAKWNYTHRYRLNGTKFQLIGATNSSGEPCVGFETYDYNLSTGKVEVEKTEEKCDEQGDNPKETKSPKTSFVVKANKPVLMDGFKPGDNEVKIPNQADATFYY